MTDFRTCGFCERLLEDDEELAPVYIGEPPEPRPVRAAATVPKQRESIGYKQTVGDNLSGGPLANDIQVLDLPADELAAMIQALENSDQFQFETSSSVHEPEPIMANDLPAAELEPDRGRNDDKVGAEITAKPRPTSQNPDFLVCEFCEESLSKE